MVTFAGYLGAILDPIVLLITYFCARFFLSKNYPFVGLLSVTTIVVSLFRETFSAKTSEQVWGDTFAFNGVIAFIQSLIVIVILIFLRRRSINSSTASCAVTHEDKD